MMHITVTTVIDIGTLLFACLPVPVDVLFDSFFIGTEKITQYPHVSVEQK